MSTQEIISHIGSLTISDRLSLLEAILQSVKAEIEHPEYKRKVAEQWKEIRRRRREFKIEGFHLGGEVHGNPDKTYSQKG
jgi:hypothetical protein